MADNTGQLFSSKRISDFLKSQKTHIAPNQVSEYADSLVEAFVVHRIGRYDIAGKRMFERSEKYFFENMGIRNVLAGYKPQDRGKRLENLVCNHLLFCGYEVKVGALRTEEIDFVCKRENEILYVQVAMNLSSINKEQPFVYILLLFGTQNRQLGIFSEAGLPVSGYLCR